MVWKTISINLTKKVALKALCEYNLWAPTATPSPPTYISKNTENNKEIKLFLILLFLLLQTLYYSLKTFVHIFAHKHNHKP